MNGKKPYKKKKWACTNWKDMTGYNNKRVIVRRKNKE